MPINCPKCGEPLILTPARTEYKGKGAVSNGLLADLKPWTDQGTITIDQRANPIVIRMPYDATENGKRNWRAINTIVIGHKGVWIKDGKNSRWEVPA